MIKKTKQTEPAAGSFKTWFGIAGLVLAGSLHVSADEIGQAEDEQLRRAAQESIRTNPYLGVFDQVPVDVDDGRVRLWGSVEQRCRREAAAARVARLAGVLEVRNEIEVQSSSPEDVMLRRRLFERLYYGGAVEGSQRLEWPVRILVSDGRWRATRPAPRSVNGWRPSLGAPAHGSSTTGWRPGRPPLGWPGFGIEDGFDAFLGIEEGTMNEGCLDRRDRER